MRTRTMTTRTMLTGRLAATSAAASPAARTAFGSTRIQPAARTAAPRLSARRRRTCLPGLAVSSSSAIPTSTTGPGLRPLPSRTMLASAAPLAPTRPRRSRRSSRSSRRRRCWWCAARTTSPTAARSTEPSETSRPLCLWLKARAFVCSPSAPSPSRPRATFMTSTGSTTRWFSNTRQALLPPAVATRRHSSSSTHTPPFRTWATHARSTPPTDCTSLPVGTGIGPRGHSRHSAATRALRARCGGAAAACRAYRSTRTTRMPMSRTITIHTITTRTITTRTPTTCTAPRRPLHAPSALSSRPISAACAGWSGRPAATTQHGQY
mmetsp:Transcript_54867/g.145447  ORF Transcript_54867/g.145447 Transcript_54867/m.145447 type:complete len:323 (+) Transcript_54867:353-1321(+)